VEANPSILQPALEFQRILRTKTFGVNYWVAKQQVRCVCAWSTVACDSHEDLPESVGGWLPKLEVNTCPRPCVHHHSGG
jgi:hypothetical protein